MWALGAFGFLKVFRGFRRFLGVLGALGYLTVLSRCEIETVSGGMVAFMSDSQKQNLGCVVTAVVTDYDAQI